jgi:membrane-bound ClpP family serine protease
MNYKLQTIISLIALILGQVVLLSAVFFSKDEDPGLIVITGFVIFIIGCLFAAFRSKPKLQKNNIK